jgi:hypothetical protein
VEHVISATDSETRPGASVTLEEIDEVLGRVAAASPFSAVDLRNKINTKYPSHRRADDVLSVLLRKAAQLRGEVVDPDDAQDL